MVSYHYSCRWCSYFKKAQHNYVLLTLLISTFTSANGITYQRRGGAFISNSIIIKHQHDHHHNKDQHKVLYQSYSHNNNNNNSNKTMKSSIRNIIKEKSNDYEQEHGNYSLQNQQRRLFISNLVNVVTVVTVSSSASLVYTTPKVLAEMTKKDNGTDEYENQCSNGAIAAEGAIPGAYQNICMGLPKRSIILKSTGDKITIYQNKIPSTVLQDDDQNSKNSNSASVAGRTGVALWNSGLLLTKLLDEIAFRSLKVQGLSSTSTLSSKDLLFNGKTVFELGCGTGFTSIAASKLGAKYVYATDGNMEVLELAKFNLERNGILPNGDGNSNSNSNYSDNENGNGNRNGEACALQWGSLDAIDYYDTADIIIGSDLTYNSGSWNLLVDTFNSVLKPNGYIIYLTLGHSGFNVSGELNGFLTVVQSSGVLEVVNVGSSDWPFLPGVIDVGGSLESLLSSSLSENERNIIKGTGGFKVVILKRKQRKRR